MYTYIYPFFDSFLFSTYFEAGLKYINKTCFGPLGASGILGGVAWARAKAGLVSA